MSGEAASTGSRVPVLHVVCRCDERLLSKVRYVFDTLLMAHDIPVAYDEQPPEGEPCLLYASDAAARPDHCVAVVHRPDAWHFLQEAEGGPLRLSECGAVPYLLGGDPSPSSSDRDIGFDLVANAFYFLSSFAERRPRESKGRRLYADSVFAALHVPQDIVDGYLALLTERLQALCARLGKTPWPAPRWPDDARYALVLSHDIDFIPSGAADIAVQGARSVMRHLVRQRDPADAWRAGLGFIRAAAQRRDPYGCIPSFSGAKPKSAFARRSRWPWHGGIRPM